MKKILLVITALLLFPEVKAQYKTTFEKVSDSLWYVTEQAYGGGMVTHEAYPVDHAKMTADINNRIRVFASLQIGGAGCAVLAVAGSAAWINTGSSIGKIVAIGASAGAIVLSAAGLFTLASFDRVEVTPGGITLRLGKATKRIPPQKQKK